MTARSRFSAFLLLFFVALFACSGGLSAGLLVGMNASSLFPALSPAIEPTLPAAASQAASPAPPTPTPSPVPLPSVSDASDPEASLIALYRNASPAVVNITTRILRRDFFFGVVPESGSGSGFVWDAQGHIVTNYHVIEDASSIDVSFGEDLIFEAEVVGVDPPNDLAVLRVPELPSGVQPLPLGDSGALEVGQMVVAIGNPFGQFQRTLTFGVISALNRTIEVQNERVLRGIIQTDAAINRGNSGGPLLDLQGRVIGITTAIYSPTGANAGIGLVIPINTAKRVVPVLIAEGRYRHPWLGIENLGYAITPNLAHVLDLPVTQGLLIARVYPHSPAALAGVRGATREIYLGNRRVLIGGDILTAINGHPLKSWEDLNAYLEENTRVGQTVTLEILRGDQQLEIAVVVGEAP
ncbi:MAG: trypsin-like serine protease [Chloroflexi bacterium]|nr:trypsin-like serine protease [Chloroflexota bacterium]